MILAVGEKMATPFIYEVRTDVNARVLGMLPPLPEAGFYGCRLLLPFPCQLTAFTVIG
jgi:hypothetical protein